MIALVILLLIAAAFFAWDRSSPVSTSPDTRIVYVGTVLAVIGLVSTFMFWWLYVPVVVLLAGATLIVLGRHRTVATP